MKLLIILLTCKLFALEPSQIQSIAGYHTKYASTVTAISYVESRHGANVGVNRIAKGIMQIEPKTVRWIATKDKRLRWISNCSDRELCYVLINNDYVNVMVGSILLDYRINKYGYSRGIERYNRIGNLDYLKKVRERL